MTRNQYCRSCALRRALVCPKHRCFIRVLRVGVLAAGLAAGGLASFGQPATGPLTVHPGNPRYFSDGEGNAIYLTGSHTWTNLQDEWIPSYNVVFDYEGYLDLLVEHNHNFIRMWRNEFPQYKYPGDLEYRFAEPHPWPRVGGDGGGGGGGGGGGIGPGTGLGLGNAPIFDDFDDLERGSFTVLLGIFGDGKPAEETSSNRFSGLSIAAWIASHTPQAKPSGPKDPTVKRSPSKPKNPAAAGKGKAAGKSKGKKKGGKPGAPKPPAQPTTGSGGTGTVGGAPAGVTQPSGAGDGGLENQPAAGKFDLSTFDEAYFARMRERVIAAGERGIYVSIMLFEGHGLQFASEGWASHPFNSANNVNGIDGDLNDDGKGTETHTLASPEVLAVQEAYVRKVIDTVNDLDNVMYEIANESHGGSVAWQNHLIEYIHDYESSKPKQHPVLFSSPLAGVGMAIWNSDAEAVSPLASSDLGSFAQDPPAADGAKVVISDSDHIFGCGSSVEWVWKSFARGLNVIYMDSYYSDTPFCPPPDEAMRIAMGQTRGYALRMNMADAVPLSTLSSTGYCLADPGDAYLVFAPTGGPLTMNLAAVAGTLPVEWLDPATGQVHVGQESAGAELATFTPPFQGPAVLFIGGGDSGPPSGPLAGDLNLDGAVNTDDLILLINLWGACPPVGPCAGDLNQSGAVDVDDLLMVIGNWTS